jgi:carbonic anhydrase/acetyltransferase-like protein (isoleucine patch superfamily)
MSAVIIDGATIGENSIVGASAFVKAREMPANHLIVGSPAKAIRMLTEQELVWKNRALASIRCWLTLPEDAGRSAAADCGRTRQKAAGV